MESHAKHQRNSLELFSLLLKLRWFKERRVCLVSPLGARSVMKLRTVWNNFLQLKHKLNCTVWWKWGLRSLKAALGFSVSSENMSTLNNECENSCETLNMHHSTQWSSNIKTHCYFNCVCVCPSCRRGDTRSSSLPRWSLFLWRSCVRRSTCSWRTWRVCQCPKEVRTSNRSSNAPPWTTPSWTWETRETSCPSQTWCCPSLWRWDFISCDS